MNFSVLKSHFECSLRLLALCGKKKSARFLIDSMNDIGMFSKMKTYFIDHTVRGVAVLRMH